MTPSTKVTPVGHQPKIQVDDRATVLLDKGVNLKQVHMLCMDPQAFPNPKRTCKNGGFGKLLLQARTHGLH